MADRVPLTLFASVTSVVPHATWSDPLNPTDPWTGYPYQWVATVLVQPQTHSDPTTTRPFSYNGLDVVIGDWLVFTAAGLALEIVSISSQTDSSMVMILEDVGLHNMLNDPGQSGNGIGPTSPPGSYDCLIINLNPSGIPVFSNLSDYSVPVNLFADIVNRFQFRNYVQDYIGVFQTDHGFSIGDVIYLDTDGTYHLSIAGIPAAQTSIGIVTSIDQPSIGNFTYRPLGRYVKNLPTLPGLPGQMLYVSPSNPGKLTASFPYEGATSIYIKVTDDSAVMVTGSGSGSGTLGNISIAGNNIAATNVNGNINLVPNGIGTVNAPRASIANITGGTASFTSLTPGRVVIVGPGGELTDSGYFEFDVPSQALAVGNLTIGPNAIVAGEGIPIVLETSNANVQIIATVDLSGNRIVNVLDPELPQDVATKSYVDAVAQGLSPKEAVYVATITDLNATFNPAVAYGSLTGNVYQRLDIDGFEPAYQARILVKNQTNEYENGIYVVAQIGSPSEPWILIRSSDFNGQGIAGDIRSGDFVFVEEGNTNGDTGWAMTSPNPIVVNVSDIHWTQFSSAGVIQAGFGLTKTGTVLDVNVAAIIDSDTGLNATPGPLGFNVIEIHISSNAPLEFNEGALRVKDSIAGTGLSYDMPSGSINILNDQPTITGLGNIISGTWNGNIISWEKGGSGLGTIGLPAQVLTVNDDGNGLGYSYRSKLTESSEAPVYPSPADGDRWFNIDSGIMFTRITDETGSHWVEL